MWVITKEGRNVRQLSLEERELLDKFAQGSCNGYEFDRATRMMRTVRSDNHWLACDCTSPAPTLNVTLRDSGRVILRSNPSGPPHAPACEFAKAEARDPGTRSAPPTILRLTPDTEITLHAEFVGTDAGVGQTGQDHGERSARAKMVLSLLLSLIESAGLNEYDPAAPKSVSDQYQRLREAASRLYLAGKIPLPVDTRLDKRAVYQMAMRLRDSKQFADRRRRVGVLLDLIDRQTARDLVLRDGQSLTFKGSVQKVGASDAPLLALVTVTPAEPGSTYYEPGHVGLVSVMNRSTWLPVFSSEERHPLSGLAALLDWLYKKHKRRVVMRRDLFREGQSIQLIGRDRSLSVSLLSGPAAGDDCLILEDGADFDQFKKRIVKAFLSETPA